MFRTCFEHILNMFDKVGIQIVTQFLMIFDDFPSFLAFWRIFERFLEKSLEYYQSFIPLRTAKDANNI